MHESDVARNDPDPDICGRALRGRSADDGAAGNLICVFVRLNTYGEDRFYVLRWPELQRVLINGYRGYLARHGGRRPKGTVKLTLNGQALPLMGR